MANSSFKAVEGTPFEYSPTLDGYIEDIATRVAEMRSVGKLSPQALKHLAQLFRVRNIYHSNAIEGNLLDLGETRLVVEQGITITGKSVRDQAEAKNLNQALDFLVELASNDQPITQVDIRQIHRLILTGIDDEEAGNYRRVDVKISGSEYEPPGPESVGPQMTDFSDWLQSVSQDIGSMDPIAVASAAHAWFVQIHPFADGNGRTGRILLDLLLMRSGYPIAIITREDRLRYYEALEESQSSDLSPLIYLVYESVEDSLEAYEQAAADQQRMGQWIADVAGRLAAPERVRLTNEFELWTRAMDLFREGFHQVIDSLAQVSGGMYPVYFKEFGNLELDKYISLEAGRAANRTWFFRIDFVLGNTSARYLFFFGYASYMMSEKAKVTLHISREEPKGSFYYVGLRDSRREVPRIVEVGYNPKSERFVTMSPGGVAREENVDAIAQALIGDILRIDFGL